MCINKQLQPSWDRTLRSVAQCKLFSTRRFSSPALLGSLNLFNQTWSWNWTTLEKYFKNKFTVRQLIFVHLFRCREAPGKKELQCEIFKRTNFLEELVRTGVVVCFFLSSWFKVKILRLKSEFLEKLLDQTFFSLKKIWVKSQNFEIKFKILRKKEFWGKES